MVAPEISGNRISAYGAICSAVGRVHDVTLNWENAVQQKCLNLNHPRIPQGFHRGNTSKSVGCGFESHRQLQIIKVIKILKEVKHEKE